MHRLPVDWKIAPLSEVAKFRNGKAHENYIHEYGSYIVVNSKFVSSDGKVIKRSLESFSPLEKNDIAIVMSDIPNGKALAKCFLCPKDNVYTLNQRIGCITGVKADPEYLFRILNRNKYYLSFDSGTGQTNLRRDEIINCPIPLPPLPEQRRIAEVLSDMDGLIGSLEKLLAKKRMIRQGMMQRLLTPQEDWEVKRLGEIGATYGGLTGKSKSDFGSGNAKYIPFLNVINNPILNPEQLDSVRIQSCESQNRAIKGDIFFNGSSETPDEVGLCSVLQQDFENLYLNSFCFGFRIFDHQQCIPLFMVYLFRSHTGREYLYSLAQGATRYNLSKTNFMELEIQIPGSIKQEEISTILQSVDTEITTIQNKISKFQNIKQGMMQKLLTGEVRL